MIDQSIKIINTNWANLLNNLIIKYPQIDELLEKENIQEIYPNSKNIFKCFNFFNIEETRIIIIGQDPYHQPNQAHGLSFSVPDNIKIPPSLKNIFKEIKDNFDGDIPESGNLEYLAKQGILLLNKTFTVRQSSPNSHLKIWDSFTKELINKILELKSNLIIMLWGGNAKKILKYIPEEIKRKHIFLEANHPSPLSANRGGWFGCKHFLKCNDILKKRGEKEIKWI